jgi:hypothetical protein
MGWFSKFKKNNVKKGDIIVCIDDRKWNVSTTISLQYNQKYKVDDIMSMCHGYCYDIGGRFTSDQTHTVCNQCRASIPGIGIHWAGAFRFRKATEEEAEEFNRESKENTQTNLDEAVEAEDYELAEKLKKELEKIL